MNRTTDQLVTFAVMKHDLAFEDLHAPLRNHACYLKTKESYDSHCFDLSTHPYALRQLYALVSLCEVKSDLDLTQVLPKTVETFCTERLISQHGFKRIV